MLTLSRSHGEKGGLICKAQREITAVNLDETKCEAWVIQRVYYMVETENSDSI